MGESEADIQLQTSQYLCEGSALLSKVASFLPKLKQANETLQDTSSTEKIDFDLEQNLKNNGNSDDEIDSTASDEIVASNESSGQVIEMNLAMGDVSEDPVFHMLGEGTSDSNDSESDSEDSEQSTRESENAIHNLLNRKRTSVPDLSEPTQQKKPSKSSPLIKVIHESKQS